MNYYHDDFDALSQRYMYSMYDQDYMYAHISELFQSSCHLSAPKKYNSHVRAEPYEQSHPDTVVPYKIGTPPPAKQFHCYYRGVLW